MIRPSEFAELQKLCLRSFPERLDQRISQFESLDGDRHPMLGLALSWREGRQPRVERLVMRRYADRWTWWMLDDPSKAGREWAILRWLYGVGMPVPRLYACGQQNGAGFTLMARLQGQGCPAQAACLGELAALLARLHQLVPLEAVRQALPLVLLSEELGRLDEIAHRLHDDGLIEALSDLLVEEVEVYPPCVLHGDPHLANALCDARGITALLDWENSALGDPRWDVARTTNWLRLHQAEELASCFCGAYEEQAGWRLSDMSFWEALTAVQSWAVVAWACTTAPPGSALAQRLLAHVDLWHGRAWRALRRLRHGRGEQHAAVSAP